MANSAFALLLLSFHQFLFGILMDLLLCSCNEVFPASGGHGGGHAAAQSHPDRRIGMFIVRKTIMISHCLILIVIFCYLKETVLCSGPAFELDCNLHSSNCVKTDRFF